jgi:hypothetical protein
MEQGIPLAVLKRVYTLLEMLSNEPKPKGE